MKGDVSPAVAGLFSADLMGAAFGTLFISLVMIPYFGIIGAAVALISLKIVSLILIKYRYETNP